MRYLNTRHLLVGAICAVSVQSLPLASIALTNLTHWGTGCPQDTTDFSVTSTGNSLLASFGEFEVSIGSSVPISDNTDFCGIGVDISAPSGQQFSVASTSYSDKLNVPDGVTATHLFTYTYAGSDTTAETRHDFVGPASGNFDETDTVPSSSRLWSPCGEDVNLMITNRGFLTDGGDTTSDTCDSYFNTGTVTTVIEWQDC